MGIEPTHLAWEANILPLKYTRIEFLQNLFQHTFTLLKSTFCFIINKSENPTSKLPYSRQ